MSWPGVACGYRDVSAAIKACSGPDARAHKRPVTVGLTTPALAEIASGLKPGESVIVKGQQGLPDGAQIAPGK